MFRILNLSVVSQNVSIDVFSAWFIFRAKISTHSGVCVEGEWQKYIRFFLSLSKDEGLKDIGNSMNIGNLILGVNNVTVSYLIHYGNLLQNATEVYYRMRQVFYYKMR